VDYILRRTGIDTYVWELGAPQPFQPFQLFHGVLEQAQLRIFGQFCAPALQVRPDCAPKILLKTALLCSLGLNNIERLATLQFRLTFKDKGHKSLEHCCLVIHLTFVISTISNAESNGGIFILIGPLGITKHYETYCERFFNNTISLHFQRP
jgi:hypothetical protein